MTIIQAKITKSGTVEPLDGFIRVLTQIAFGLSGDDDGTLTVPVSEDYQLDVDGEVEFDLAPSDLQKVQYIFQIYEDLETIIDPETEEEIPQIPALIKTFQAVVPFSEDPIKLTQLAQQNSVRYDQQDAALLTLSRFLATSQTFWSALVNNLWNHQGTFNPATFYRHSDVVNYLGSSYQYISPLASSGTLPTDSDNWRLIAAKGETGTGTSGNDEPYGTTWEDEEDAPSRGALYDILETFIDQAALDLKANLASPNLTGNPTAPTQTLGNRTTRIASTAFVGNELDEVAQAPVGSIIIWTTPSAPTGWRNISSATGEVVAQATFPELFSIIGTSFNTGGEGAGNFRLPNIDGFPNNDDLRMRWILRVNRDNP